MRRLPSFKSINSRLMFWFLIMALLPLLIALVITYFQRISEANDRSLDKLIAIRDLKTLLINKWIDENNGDLRMLAEDIELRTLGSILQKSKKSIEDVKKIKVTEELLKRNLISYDRFDEFFIVGVKNGLVELSTNPSMLGENKSLNPYFLMPIKTGKQYIGAVYYSETTKGPQMTFSMPIKCLSDSKHIFCVLVARIDLANSLYKLLENKIGLGNTGESLIVNNDYIALSNLIWHENAPLNFKIDAFSAKNAAQGKTGIAITKDYRGQEVMTAYTYIPRTGWGFITKQDTYELNAPIRKMIKEFVILFMLTSFFIILGAIGVSKTISKPIAELNKHANRIKAGDYTPIITVSSEDEVGSLISSINEMTDSIQIKVSIQKGVADISSSIIRQSTLQEFSASLLEKIKFISKANMSAFYMLNELTLSFDPFFTNGIEESLLKSIIADEPTDNFGKELLKKNIFQLSYPFEDSIFNSVTANEYNKSGEMIVVPILIEDIIVAFVIIAKTESFPEETINILEQSWNNINTSYSSLISNMRVSVLAENVLIINDQLDIKTAKLNEQNIVLENQKNKVEEANKELDAFAYSVSHDLRAPLRAIHGFTSILQEDFVSELGEEGKRIGAIIQKNSKKMGELIDDLLVFSRMSRANISTSLIDMKRLADTVYNEATTTKERGRIEFNITDLPKIKGDPTMIRQVWVNLISNALKFTSKRKKAIISIYCKQEIDSFTYIIKDNGVGFDMKYKNKLFGVFQRLHGENELEGTGVGLALIQRITHRHSGKTWAEGKVNKGATFYFSLPYNSDDNT